MNKEMQDRCDSTVKKLEEAVEELYGYIFQDSNTYGELEEKINSVRRYLIWPHIQDGEYIWTKMKAISENEEKGLPLKK